VRAVNLMPSEARRGGGRQIGRSGGAVYLVLGVLAAALVLVVMYVLAGNKISDRKAKLATLQTEAANARTQAAQLAPYTTFATLASARAETVRQITSARFDWHQSLSDLSRVVPSNTSLQSLVATVAPGAGGGGGIAFRTAIVAPAFELTGCTTNQDDVARLMSRMRLMRGVTRVTLQDSTSSNTPAPTAGSVTSSSAGGSTPSGCGPKAPTFHVVVFFQPIPGAAATGVGGAVTTPGSATTAAPGGTAPAASSATTPTATTPSGTTGTPASTTGSAG
jgi:Tfp pilus assembly protein PilN